LQAFVKKDLEFAIKEFPQNKEIAKCLWRVFKESDPTRAWNYLAQYVLNDGEDIYEFDDFIEGVDAWSFENILNDFQVKSNNQLLYCTETIQVFIKPNH
jgi:hypothetical protein